MLYFLLIPVSLIIYLAIHFYFSFFVSYNIVLTLSIIILFLMVLFFCWMWLYKLNSFLPQYIVKTLRFGIYFTWGIMLYCATLYLIADILKVFVKISPYKEGIIVVSLACLIAIAGYINTRFIREISYDILSNKIEKPIKIILISDLHIGSSDITLSKMNSLVEKINRQNADIVIIAGDLVDDASFDPVKLGYCLYFNSIKSKYGVFATVGNHETYRGDTNKIIADLEKSNVKFIEDRNIFLKDININLVGISDIGRSKRTVFSLDNINLIENNFNLIIEHNPIRFNQNSKYNIDLQVSGHTHAGQIIHGYLIEKLMYEKSWGLLQKEKASLITSSGVGSWGPPIRDITYPEMVIINIKPQ